MGLELTIQSLSRIGWPGTSGQDSANPQLAGSRRRDFNPAGAETPEEALAYIELLYKAGRTDELVALLRRSQVFREAWQTLQQFTSLNSAVAGELTSPLPAAARAPGSPGLPAPLSGPGPNGRLQSPSQDQAFLLVRASSESSGEISGAQNFPVLTSRPARHWAAALQVYETQARYYAQERADSPRISLRV